jgi:hypothetical protein
MPDYNFLLGAQVPQAPNPLQLAGQGLTLGNLATQNQLGQLNIQKLTGMVQAMQDPAVMNAWSQVMSGSGGAPDFSPFAKYGLGGQELMSNLLSAAEKTAHMGADQATAFKNRQEGAKMEYQNLGNYANSINPDKDDPQVVINAANSIAQRLQAINPIAFNGMDQSSPGAFLKSVATHLMDPEVQQKLALGPQELAVKQGELALNEAKFYNGEAFQDPASKAWFIKMPTGGGNWTVKPATWQQPGVQAHNQPGAQAPSGAGVSVQQPGGNGQPRINVQNASPGEVAAMNADIASGGNVFTPAAGGAGAEPPVAPLGTAPPPTQAGGKLPTDASGAPVTGPNFQTEAQIKEDITAAGKEQEDATAKANAAAQIQSLVLEQRNRAANGILSGQIMGQPEFLKMANILAPWLSDKDYQTLSNSQAWTRQTNQIIALAVKQFAGSRIAARELPFFGGAKADATQTPMGMEETFGDMYRIADQTLQLKQQMDAYQAPPGRAGLVGFVPHLTSTQLPPVQYNAPNGKMYNFDNLMDAERWIPRLNASAQPSLPVFGSTQPGIPQP